MPLLVHIVHCYTLLFFIKNIIANAGDRVALLVNSGVSSSESVLKKQFLEESV